MPSSALFLCIVELKLQSLSHLCVVDLYYVISDKKAEKRRVQLPSLFYKPTLRHQYCRGIHTAGLED